MNTANRANTQQLLTFLMEKHGGEEAVYREFYGKQIGELTSQGLTLKELRAAAKEDGWLSMLDDMKVTAIASIVNPQTTAHSGLAGAGKRLTQAEINKLRDDILVYLADHPWQSKNEIAEGVDFQSRKLSAQLSTLKKTGKIRTEGEKAGMRYALNSEKSKP